MADRADSVPGGAGREIVDRVEGLVAESGASRTEAIRRVADELGRTESSTRSAFYAARRRAVEADEGPAPAGSAADARRQHRSAGHVDAPALYAEMLPLVEAGATVEQAARRFGDDDSVAEIAAGFSRWLAREGASGLDAPEDPGPRLARAEARVTALEEESRRLREEVARLRDAVDRARAVLDDAGEEPD